MIRVEILAVALCFCWQTAAAQNALSLQDAVREALRGSPRLAGADARVAEANGGRVQARLRPNPRATLQSEDIRPSQPGLPFSFANSTEDYFLLGQVLEIGGKRERRIALAGAAVNTAGNDRERVRRAVVAQVIFAYWTAVGARRIAELNEQNLRTYAEDVSYSSNRVKEGVAAEADLIRIEIERDRVHASLLTAQRDVDQASIELLRAIGRVDFTPVTLTSSIDQLPAVPLPDVDTVLARRPDVAVARSVVSQAEADLQLQHALAKPDPEAFVGYKRNVGYDTAYVAVQMDLPLHNRNQGNIATAVARVHESEDNLRALQASIRADIQSAQQAYLDERALLDDLQKTLAQAQESERLTRAAYREGALDLLRLLDAERSRIQVQLEYSRALADLQQATFTLRQASGDVFDGSSEVLP